MTNYALTFDLMGSCVTVDDQLWTIIEVDMSGDVLLLRESDNPKYSCPVYFSNDPRNYEMLDFPGVAYHKWFPGSVLAEQIQNKWDRW